MEIQERLPGERITFTTRAIADSVVDRKGLYQKIIEVFENNDKYLSAKDIAVELFKKKLLPSDSRQEVAPRLTEMSQKGWIEPYGSKQRDNYSGVLVTVYKLRKTPEEIRKEINTKAKKGRKK